MKFDIKTAGAILVKAGGPDVFRGTLIAYLKSLKIQRCLDYIHENRDLLDSWGDKEWGALRKIVKESGIQNPEKEFTDLLDKHCPNLVAVILYEPGGKEWLAGQIAKLKARLG